MAIKITSVTEAVSNNGLKALVHAPAGTGKTVLAATAQEKTLIISAESGLLSLSQDEVVLKSKGSPDFDPSYCEVVEVKMLGELSEVFDILEKEHDYKWVVLDSITEIAEIILANELEETKDPRKAYGELQQKMVSILKSFRDLPSVNVLMTCKQERKEDDAGITMFTPMMPGAKLSQQIPYLFDEVWCLRIAKDDEGNTFHFIQATRDMQYEAKDRSGKLTDCEPPSLKKLHDKIYGGNQANPDC